MAAEDYKVDGTDTNVSSYFKFQKLIYGKVKFNQLKERYNIKEISNDNNIILFTLNNNEYYYGLISSKIRKKGDIQWTGKVITFLNNELGLKRGENKLEKIFPIVRNKFTFGKYKGKSLDWVRINDINYLIWCVDNVEKFPELDLSYKWTKV